MHLILFINEKYYDVIRKQINFVVRALFVRIGQIEIPRDCLSVLVRVVNGRSECLYGRRLRQLFRSDGVNHLFSLAESA